MFSKSKLDQVLPDFVTYLSSKNCIEDYLLYEVQKAWSDHWDIEAVRLTETYESALQSQISQRLWRSSDYEPKEMMLRFLNHDKEMVRIMFRDLFNEAKPIDLRIQRFSYHCDELFTAYRKANPNQKLRSHYHDHRMISLYLLLNNPIKYLFFDENSFVTSMQKLGARNFNSPVVTESYYKIGAILGKFLNENETLSNVLKKRLTERRIKMSKGNAIVNIFITWLGNSK